MPKREPDLETEIYALPTESGGRKHPMVSGNRPIHSFGLPNELNGALHEYPENGKIAPGETAIALLWLLAPDRLNNFLFEGMEFTVQDGTRIVGKGRILKVLKPELKRRHYIKVRWIHELIDEPEWLYSELDSERWETRKIYIFSDNTWAYADQEESYGEIALSECPISPLSEIAADLQFSPCEITKEEFENFWSKRKLAKVRKPTK